MKDIFTHLLKFYNVKQKMNLEKVISLIFQANFDFFLMNNCFT